MHDTRSYPIIIIYFEHLLLVFTPVCTHLFFTIGKKLFFLIKGVPYDVDATCLICSGAFRLRSPEGWRIALQHAHPTGLGKSAKFPRKFK